MTVTAARLSDNAIGTRFLDQAKKTSPTISKNWGDTGFKRAVIEHGANLGIDVEVVNRNPGVRGFHVVKRRWVGHLVATAQAVSGSLTHGSPRPGGCRLSHFAQPAFRDRVKRLDGSIGLGITFSPMLSRPSAPEAVSRWEGTQIRLRTGVDDLKWTSGFDCRAPGYL